MSEITACRRMPHKKCRRWVDVKTGSGMIDFRSVASLVATAMIIITEFLTFCIDCCFYHCVSVCFSKTDTFLYVALTWFGNIYLGPGKKKLECILKEGKLLN